MPSAKPLQLILVEILSAGCPLGNISSEWDTLTLFKRLTSATTERPGYHDDASMIMDDVNNRNVLHREMTIG